MSAPALDPFLALLRRWAVDWLGGANPEICEEILAPGYAIHIGGFVLDGRDAYVAGTMEQLGRFPGLVVSVHQLIHNGERVALRFSEHGASARLDGRAAAWGGIALFESDEGRLTRCFAEEDYLSRRRQLDGGDPDPIDRPATAPWNTAIVAPDPGAERTVRDWLEDDGFAGAECDDAWLGNDAGLDLGETTLDIDLIFSAGRDVAFHGVRRGAEAELNFAGIVTVEGDGVSGRVVRDRLGFERARAKAAEEGAG